MALEALPLADSPARTPIYTGVRGFLGRIDLVVSFYTRKCQFGCSYCALPLRSSNGPVSVEDVNAQIDGVFAQYADVLGAIEQVSFGNEGSALDGARFHRESLMYLIDRLDELPKLELVSMETRPEYVKRDVIEQIQDVTVGFETQDDHIRQTILNKSIARKLMEQRIELLGELGMRLTSYVMVKPAPRMTDEQAVSEALATIAYLRERCDAAGVELVAYLTPTYIAEGSQLAQTSEPEDWLPPRIQDVARVVLGSHALGVPVYTGLWSEGLAGTGGDYSEREGYDPELRNAIAELNRTNDFGVMQRFADAR
jgi:archaeosine synthase beta-subunit